MEGIVIVLSILLAFAIDAYWEERQEAANTRQSIEVVRRDLVDALEQLDEMDQFSAEIARASVEAARAGGIRACCGSGPSANRGALKAKHLPQDHAPSPRRLHGPS